MGFVVPPCRGYALTGTLQTCLSVSPLALRRAVGHARLEWDPGAGLIQAQERVHEVDGEPACRGGKRKVFPQAAGAPLLPDPLDQRPDARVGRARADARAQV